MQRAGYLVACHAGGGGAVLDLYRDLTAILADHPGAAGVFLVYAAGCLTGWRLARRATGYMLGGRP